MVNDHKRLGDKVMNLLSNPYNRIFVSVASVWEMIIKERKGKLKIPPDFKKQIRLSGFSLLNIESNHVFELKNLPDYHNDPFDRIIISQARLEGLPLITFDENIQKYDLKIVNK